MDDEMQTMKEEIGKLVHGEDWFPSNTPLQIQQKVKKSSFSLRFAILNSFCPPGVIFIISLLIAVIKVFLSNLLFI